MKEEAIEFANLNSSLNIGNEERPIETYVQLVGEGIVIQSRTWLSCWIWHKVEKSILGSNLNEESMGGGVMWTTSQHQ